MADDGTDGGAAERPAVRVLAEGRDWRVTEQVCRAGPDARPFEERHPGFAVAAVVAGTFTYRAHAGRALLHPGAVLLGNAGTGFACGHDHSRGDRCLALQVSPERFAEVASAVAGSSRFTFPAAMLPSGRAVLAPVARLEASAATDVPGRIEEAATGLLEAAVAAASGRGGTAAAVTPGDARRICRVLDRIEADPEAPSRLDDLAAVAAMSPYHFLRTFRRTTGVTPHQYLIAVRMRRAAVALAWTDGPVTAVAYAAGFGDLSTFNRGFRARFGTTPQGFRKGARG